MGEVMPWFLIIGLGVTAALAIGYRTHVRDRRNLKRAFQPLAAKHGGTISPGSWLALPQLRFSVSERRYYAGALATDGAEGPPFTFLEVELPFDSGRSFRWKPPWRSKDNSISGTSVLELSMRAALERSGSAVKELRLKGNRLSLIRHGVTDTASDLEAMTTLADQLADHLTRSV